MSRKRYPWIKYLSLHRPFWHHQHLSTSAKYLRRNNELSCIKSFKAIAGSHQFTSHISKPPTQQYPGASGATRNKWGFTSRFVKETASRSSRKVLLKGQVCHPKVDLISLCIPSSFILIIRTPIGSGDLKTRYTCSLNNNLSYAQMRRLDWAPSSSLLSKTQNCGFLFNCMFYHTPPRTSAVALQLSAREKNGFMSFD